MRRFRFLLMLLPLALSACGWAEWPASGQPRASNAPPPSKAAQMRAGSAQAFVGASAVTVGKGDTVYALSRRHGVSVRAIIAANGLAPPYHLKVGQRIKLPRERGHVVARDETLYGISRRYGVGVYELAKANNIGTPYTIRVGQRLRIPGSAGAAPAPAKQRTMVASAPVPKKPVTVGRTPTRTAARVPTPPRRSGKGFIWPVRGKVISNYGAKAKGLHNDGINIAAPRGTAVKVVENGVVAYAGNELRGFGNLLLIKHDGGWITAYAHNDVLNVKRGQKVSKGQTIARVGSTGSVTRPQLHFEMRKGKRTVDPRKYLKA